jgi:hypothetical protein
MPRKWHLHFNDRQHTDDFVTIQSNKTGIGVPIGLLYALYPSKVVVGGSVWVHVSISIPAYFI